MPSSESGRAQAARASSPAPCSTIAPVRAVDPPVELVERQVERDDRRRVARVVCPQPVVGGCERAPGLGELERADDAPAVVRVHARGGCRVALGEQRVRCLGSEPVDLAASARAPGAGGGGISSSDSAARK